LVGTASFGASFKANLQTNSEAANSEAANSEAGLAALVGIGTAVRAELPPGSYDSLRVSAPEAVVIEVVAVTRRPGTQGATTVTLQAKVLTVERSNTGLKKGDVVSIRYLQIAQNGFVGPRPVPLLEKGAVYPAFLRKEPQSKMYEPAAYGESFRLTPEQ
jgi:hypothetical protein